MPINGQAYKNIVSKDRNNVLFMPYVYYVLNKSSK